MVAILVIDMLVEFVTGRLGSVRAKRVVPKIKKLIQAAREKGIPIIYVCDAHGPDDYEFKVWGPHAIKGTEENKIVPELAPQPGDLVIEKRTYSAFYNTKLDEELRARNIKTVILTGVLTDVCIQHTAADAFFRGYNIIVARNATESISDTKKSRAMNYMRRVYRIQPLSIDQIINKLDRLKETGLAFDESTK